MKCIQRILEISTKKTVDFGVEKINRIRYNKRGCETSFIFYIFIKGVI